MLYTTKIAMYRTESDSDVHTLRAELRKKEHDVILAARFGKELLEENVQLKEELQSLRKECTTLEEVSYNTIKYVTIVRVWLDPIGHNRRGYNYNNLVLASDSRYPLLTHGL